MGTVAGSGFSMLSTEGNATTECDGDVGSGLLGVDRLHLVGAVGGVGGVFRCEVGGNGRLNRNDFGEQTYVGRDGRRVHFHSPSSGEQCHA